ncbi:MAG: insulinase family protein, partial [Bacteroidales bacterium]|nr:insulinase family protein [Bacteroidales bacterium]
MATDSKQNAKTGGRGIMEKYNYFQLNNGIKVIHKEVDSNVTHVGLVVNTGTRDELPDENGIAHFIEHTIFKSTQKRNTYQVLSYLENVGGDVNAYTTKEETFFYASVLNRYFDRALELLSDIVFHAAFHEKDLETEKEVVMEDRNDEVSELKLGSNGNSPLFSNCPLDSVYIGRNITYNASSRYGYSPFYRNTSLRSVTITDKETEISDNEFYGCTNLKNVSIGDGVERIGDWAFSGCSNLDYFAFGSSVKSIGKEAFSDCTSVTKLISRAATPPTCGAQALDDINKWNCTLLV